MVQKNLRRFLSQGNCLSPPGGTRLNSLNFLFTMHITLDYGQSGLPLNITDLSATVISPRFVEGIVDEESGFLEAVKHPIRKDRLKTLIDAEDTVALVIPDITRALPNERLLGWLFQELSHVPADNFTIISGTGTHRENTADEWIYMVGESIYRNYPCINHRGGDEHSLVRVGTSPFGYDVHMNKAYAEADRRILLGFIEPHFMAGFSGGYKAAFPGVTSVAAILKYHSAANIGHPGSTWGNLENNPTQDNIRAGGALVPVDFLVNVTLNNQRAITGFFFGDPIEAHNAGCQFCKKTAMVGCAEPFDIVVTSNSGYPLDQNLYQTVKGMSAAAQILKPGGLIIAASRCNDGFPSHGNFRDFLFQHDSPQALLDKIHAPGFEQLDQWQVQLLAIILMKGRVALFSELPDEQVAQAHMIPVRDVRKAIDDEVARLGGKARIAILPEGPLTIPYLTGTEL